MHKGVILLVQAYDRAEAINSVREFMGAYKDDVWDWYVIGGRWARTLNPLSDRFLAEANDLCWAYQKKIDPDSKFLYERTVDACDRELQVFWEQIGGQNSHPLSNHYRLPENGTEDDVVFLKDAIDTVREWHQDHIEEGKKALDKAYRWLNGESATDNYEMYGYCLKCAGKIFHQDFSFQCNVFNTTSLDFSIPEDLDGWFAVMIDMHN